MFLSQMQDQGPSRLLKNARLQDFTKVYSFHAGARMASLSLHSQPLSPYCVPGIQSFSASQQLQAVAGIVLVLRMRLGEVTRRA